MIAKNKSIQHFFVLFFVLFSSFLLRRINIFRLYIYNIIDKSRNLFAFFVRKIYNVVDTYA